MLPDAPPMRIAYYRAADAVRGATLTNGQAPLHAPEQVRLWPAWTPLHRLIQAQQPPYPPPPRSEGSREGRNIPQHPPREHRHRCPQKRVR